MDVTLREPLVLFSHPMEMEPGLEGIRSLSAAHLRAERVGVGGNAGHRTTHLLEERRPSVVIVLGSSGWLHLRDPPPVPIWVDLVKNEAGRVVSLSAAIPNTLIEGAGFHRGKLITVRRPVMDYRRAQELSNEHQVDIADMESYLICQASKARGIPTIVVRGVTDLAGQRVREQYRTNVGPIMRQVGKAMAPILDWLDRREQARVAQAKRGSA